MKTPEKRSPPAFPAEHLASLDTPQTKQLRIASALAIRALQAAEQLVAAQRWWELREGFGYRGALAGALASARQCLALAEKERLA
jgi:hypothetical protein